MLRLAFASFRFNSVLFAFVSTSSFCLASVCFRSDPFLPCPSRSVPRPIPVLRVYASFVTVYQAAFNELWDRCEVATASNIWHQKVIPHGPQHDRLLSTHANATRISTENPTREPSTHISQRQSQLDGDTTDTTTHQQNVTPVTPTQIQRTRKCEPRTPAIYPSTNTVRQRHHGHQLTQQRTNQQTSTNSESSAVHGPEPVHQAKLLGLSLHPEDFNSFSSSRNNISSNKNQSMTDPAS